MIKQLKTVTLRMVAGGNVAAIMLMVLTGYADRIDPIDHAYLSCIGITFPVLLVVNMLFLFFWLTFKLKYSLIPIVGYFLVYPSIAIYMPFNMEKEVPKGAIKVLTYNVQAFTGMPRYDGAFDMIYEYIKQSNADILCLQEDMNSSGVDRSRLDSLYDYVDTIHVGDKNRNAIGIYTRYPIVKKERIPYTSAGNGSCAYFLKVDADTILVINNHFESNHFSLDDRQEYKDLLKGKVKRDSMENTSKMIFAKLADAAKTRAPQVKAVHRYIETHKRYPIVVCGDFNDNPISFAHRTMAEGMTDCYVESGKGIGLSYNQKGFFVRIDNIMCSEQFTPYNCKVDSKIDASDHYPMYCWLEKSNNKRKKSEK